MLTTVQKFCRRQGISVPSTVLGSGDDTIAQIYSLLEEECTELATRGPWAGLRNQCEFLSLASESQGTLSSLGSGPTSTNNLNYIISQTFWDRSQRLPVLGPYDPQDWQAVKAVQVTGPQYYCMIRGSDSGGEAELLMNPAPPAGHTMAFEYVTWNWCRNFVSTGVYTPGQSFTNDADLFQVPENIVLMGLRWRYKKEKNLPYAEDFSSYEEMVAAAFARDGMKQVLHMDSAGYEPKPGIWVPSGNWPHP